MFTKEMQRALEADGEKLRQLTGEDHGPWRLDTHAMQAIDWENACHELLWEKGQKDLFLTIQRRAIDLFAERELPTIPRPSSGDPDEPRF